VPGLDIVRGVKTAVPVIARDADDARRQLIATGIGAEMQTVADARDADDHLIPIDKRCHIGKDPRLADHAPIAQPVAAREIFAPLDVAAGVERDVPHDGTCAPIERDEPRVDRCEVDPAVARARTAIRQAAARLAREPMVIAPEHAALPGVQRHDVVARCREVHDAVDHERRRLERAAQPGMKGPGRRERRRPRAVDLRERRVVLVRVRAARRAPIPCGARSRTQTCIVVV